MSLKRCCADQMKIGTIGNAQLKVMWEMRVTMTTMATGRLTANKTTSM